MTKRSSRMFSAAHWGVGLVLCAATAAGPAAAAVAPIDGRSAAQISAALQAPVSVSHSRATGAVRFLRVAPGSQASLAPAAGSLDERARGFFAAQASLFGIRDTRAELFLRKTTTDAAGYQHVIYDQFYRGVPVFAGELRAHFDGDGRLRAVNGNFVPEIDLQVAPVIAAPWASQRAIDYVRDRNGRASDAGLSATTPSLVIYRLGLDKGVAGTSHLAWRVDVSNGGDIREFVFVDARYGKVIDYLPGVHDAMSRRAFPGTDGAAPANSPEAWPASPDWEEGDAIPSAPANQERDNMLISSGDVYQRFFAGFGRDSYDAAGHVMDQAYERDYGCPNASWNGNLISFCPGFTTHDVTAHEWGHAYTEYTHNLIYRWQSGALNEAYSDIWGEAFDLETTLANMTDTDAPNVLRTANSCTATQAGLPRQLLVNSPGAIAGTYASGQPSFGPNVVANAPTEDVVRVIDDGSVTADLNDACETTPLVNAAALAGKIAFVNRGTCNISEKTVHVQAAGAIGMILGNVVAGAASSAGCGTVPDCSGITIPTVTLTLADANLLRAQLDLPATINVTFQPGPGVAIDNSIRWLMGEDVTGGALRDMWNPTCFANPGKVTDSQYFCATTDNGGVHFNSGVPNHAFALLVDGGVYNGQTVTSIGMVKALHLYYRAQTVYQLAASDFGDHADAMEASCDDLVTAATSLTDPWGGPPETMLAADCTEVADAMLAVEMRTEPTACNFQPLLAQSPPAICSSGFPYTTELFDWEGGAAGWTVSRRGVVNPGTFLDRDWTIDASLPGGRSGSAFFALDPTDGDCIVDDETGALVLESPTFVMPFGGAVPRLTFDHYVATEATWDGGNVKISVNGGPYTVVAPAAFSFNAQATALSTVGAGNTNPLAGEMAWHGTDGGSNSGTWGRTIGNLTGIVAPGQNFKLRYEFGGDGCGGTDLGWWVDDVQLYTCQAAEPLFIDGFEISTSSRWSSTAP